MNAILGVLISLLVRGSALVGLGALACFVARRRSAALRHAIWCAVLVAIAVLPIAQARVPAWRIPLAAPAIAISAATGRVQAPPLDIVRETAHPTARSSSPSPAAWVVLAWAAIALAFVARLAVAHHRLAQIARRAQPLEHGPAPVLMSDEIAIPIVVGWRKPRVLLPRSSRDWTPACRRGVVLHELAHVHRGDLPWLTFARALSAVLWFHPLVHFACARLRIEAERASDDAVLRHGETPSGYAQVLLDLSTRLLAPRYEAGVPLLRREHLSERIESIVESSRSHASLGLFSKLILPPALLLAIVLVASPTFGRAAESESRWIQGHVPREAKGPVRLLGVRARLTPVNDEARIDSPELELENTSRLTVRSVLVRLATPGLSTDQFWCSVAVAPGARATLRIASAQWANEGPTGTLSAFEATITDARETAAPGHGESEVAPRAMTEPAPTAPPQAEPLAAKVFQATDAPVLIESAWTPRSSPTSDNDMDRGHDLTWTPGFDLRNTSTRTVRSVRIRFKADPISHAVTAIEGPIAPGKTLRIVPGQTMWGRPEAMTIQVLGVLFTDGSVWGSLDSTIDTRQGWIR